MTLPARQRLVQVVASLRRRLPAQLEGLLDHPRFAAGRDALSRLAESVVPEAVAAMSPEEADALAVALLDRWAAIGDVVLDPHAGIVHPEEVWVGVRATTVEVSLEVVDADVDDVVWDGATAAGDRRAVVTITPPASDAFVRAHVRARTAAGRCVLIATARIAIRQPRLAISEDRRRIVVSDHTGRPAVGVALDIGGEVVLTGPGGLVELVTPVPPTATFTLAGIPIPR